MLFYLEKPSQDVGREGGRFFGTFRVISPHPFFESGGTHLLGELGMPLPYRLLIEPNMVYTEGLTEWQLMDEMTDFKSTHDIPWTVIYRKMEGGRGCTPLLPHEADKIKAMLDLRNSGQTLHFERIGFCADTISLCPSDARTAYGGVTDVFDRIDLRLRQLMQIGRACELHMQAYLMQEIGRNRELTRLLFPNVQITWIGNEVYCGAGKQCIDILVFSQNEYNNFVHLLEIKSGIAGQETATQLNRYIKWLKAHIPEISVHQIIPTVVARGTADQLHGELQNFLRGHGITQYREVTFDSELRFAVVVHRVR